MEIFQKYNFSFWKKEIFSLKKEIFSLIFVLCALIGRSTPEDYRRFFACLLVLFHFSYRAHCRVSCSFEHGKRQWAYYCIASMRESGKNVADIAISMSCSKGTASKTLKRARDHNTLVSLPRTGRPKKTTQSDKRFLVLNSWRFRRKTVPILTEEFNQSRSKADQISNATTRNILNQADNCGRVAVNKPFLRKINMKKQLKFAKKHVNWTKKRWRRVLFTDEGRYEFQCLSDVPRKSRTTLRRRKHEKYSSQFFIPTVKHGGGIVNDWGGICTRGTTTLKLINGIKKKKDYRQILIHHAIPGGGSCKELVLSFSKTTTQNIRRT